MWCDYVEWSSHAALIHLCMHAHTHTHRDSCPCWKIPVILGRLLLSFLEDDVPSLSFLRPFRWCICVVLLEFTSRGSTHRPPSLKLIPCRSPPAQLTKLNIGRHASLWWITFFPDQTMLACHAQNNRFLIGSSFSNKLVCWKTFPFRIICRIRIRIL